jgi:hypothetical protein
MQNKTRQILLLVLTFLVPLLTFAENENLTHNVIGSAGTVLEKSGVASLSFTMGEVVIGTTSLLNKVQLTQGFQQVELTPINSTIQNVNIADGTTKCYSALNILTVAGDNTTVSVASGGSLTLKAGKAIHILPTTVVALDGYMLAKIVTDGSFCNPSANDFLPVTKQLMTPDPVSKTEAGLFTLYPNPTSGSAKIVYHGKEDITASNVMVFNLQGNKIDNRYTWSNKQGDLSLQSCPPGIYMIKIITNASSQTFRLIKL